MYCTSGFEAETLEELKDKYVEYYSDGFIVSNDVRYIVYQHPTGIEVSLSDRQLNDFVEDVNNSIKYENLEYQSQKQHERSFSQPY